MNDLRSLGPEQDLSPAGRELQFLNTVCSCIRDHQFIRRSSREKFAKEAHGGPLAFA
jgi:hypothetical protein